MKLTNFIGNEKVIDRLSKLMESGRFPHALIIEGEEGIGKKTLAKELRVPWFAGEMISRAANVLNAKRYWRNSP